ncbi:bifunctional nicotinamide mononucleotide adenylyltransferase/ADP-ribose pyrophosphatase [Providencia alcalifaciens]|nr:bifunctional nicotinamide mononucleotide adenylyltransferase/ADP-ribose pyrophosphatase [Providencia alcalifaciens]
MTEKEFLSNYDRRDYLTPLLTVDTVLFTYHENTLKVLLVERANYPQKGQWGLPGGFVDENCDTTLDDTVYRKLKEKTGGCSSLYRAVMYRRKFRARSSRLVRNSLLYRTYCSPSLRSAH